MSYIVFARKWRPQNFDEVIGQRHITTTLKNAISLNHVAHAYLFSGPRGSGKTSTARILAKSLNCEGGPTINPCDKCVSCVEIAEGRSLDCIEIDGASNRGIDEIRDLRENVKFSPAKGRFKVYIIDEVHMLTLEAFNALLKTLEEPPSHIKFVFATTQPHKVPMTILSRCQRFDFRRISIPDIISKLKRISKVEKLQISEDGLFAIAKASDGSMRDAESILDQLTTFSKDKIDSSDISSCLGIVEQETLFELAGRVAQKDASGCLKLIDSLMRQGKDLMQFVINLIEHFRNIMLAKVGANLQELIELSKESIEMISEQSRNFSLEEVLYIIQLLTNAQEIMRRSGLMRIPLEMALIKLAKRDSIASLEEILNKIDELEKRIVPLQEDRQKEEPEYISAQTKAKGSTLADSHNPPSQIPLEQVKDNWQRFIDQIRQKKMSVASYLMEGSPVKVEGNVITIGFPPEFLFHKEALEWGENKRLIEQLLTEFLKTELKVSFVDLETPQQKTEVKPEHKAPPSGPPEIRPRIEPIIESAIKIFGGKMVSEIEEEKKE